jgi:hypothetical protein
VQGTGTGRRRFAHALLFVAPALWSANLLVARWSADWFPPHALAFAAVVSARPDARLYGGILRRARAMRREWVDLLVLGALACGSAAFVTSADGPRPQRTSGLSTPGAGAHQLMVMAVFRESAESGAQPRRDDRARGVLTSPKGDPATLVRLDRRRRLCRHSAFAGRSGSGCGGPRRSTPPTSSAITFAWC